jgi:hypothetical protein
VFAGLVGSLVGTTKPWFAFQGSSSASVGRVQAAISHSPQKMSINNPDFCKIRLSTINSIIQNYNLVASTPQYIMNNISLNQKSLAPDKLKAGRTSEADFTAGSHLWSLTFVVK